MPSKQKAKTKEKETPMTARKLQKVISDDMSSITFGFSSGEQMTVKMADIPEEIVHQLALHGLSQKATDATAGKDAETAEARVRDVVNSLLAGRWTVRGSGAGGGGTRVTQLVEAIARLKDYSIEEATAAVAKLSDDEKKNLQKAPSVKQMILTIKQEKLAAAGAESEAESEDALAKV